MTTEQIIRSDMTDDELLVALRRKFGAGFSRLDLEGLVDQLDHADPRRADVDEEDPCDNF